MSVDELVRSKYLVDVLGHCAECHSPRTKATFAMDGSRLSRGQSTIEGSTLGADPDTLVARLDKGRSGQVLPRRPVAAKVMTFRMSSVLEHSLAWRGGRCVLSPAAYPDPEPRDARAEGQVCRGQTSVRAGNCAWSLCAGCRSTQGQGQPHSSVPMSTNTRDHVPRPST